MACHPITLHGRLALLSRQRHGSQAFTLMELLVSAALLAVVSSGTALLISLANSSLTSSTTLAAAQAAIDSDISRARKLAEDYSCCPGRCTANANALATARSQGKCAGNVNDSTYYFPQLDADVPAFLNACANGTLTANLITEIQALGPLSGINRSVSEDDSSDSSDHRIRLTHSASGTGAGIQRVVKIVPTVAGWCP